MISLDREYDTVAEPLLDLCAPPSTKMEAYKILYYHHVIAQLHGKDDLVKTANTYNGMTGLWACRCAWSAK